MRHPLARKLLLMQVLAIRKRDSITARSQWGSHLLRWSTWTEQVTLWTPILHVGKNIVSQHKGVGMNEENNIMR